MRTGDVAGTVGRGLAAGVAGTALMTLAKALATDAFHHLVYAAGTSLAFSVLDRS